jgi:hypothetical protein
LKDKSRLAEEKSRAKEAECRELQRQLEIMASPAARQALMKKLVPGAAQSPRSPKKGGGGGDSGNNNEEINKKAEKVPVFFVLHSSCLPM